MMLYIIPIFINNVLLSRHTTSIYLSIVFVPHILFVLFDILNRHRHGLASDFTLESRKKEIRIPTQRSENGGHRSRRHPPTFTCIAISITGLPRIEYSPEQAPFPTGASRSNSDKRAAMKKEISELQEVNVERYSTLERSTEKMAECKAIIELIQGLSEEYGIEVNQELIESPLEGATLVELELRQTALLELYDLELLQQ